MKIKLTLILILACFVCNAKQQYMITSMKDVEIHDTVTGQHLKLNVAYEIGKGAIHATWLSDNGYYHLLDVSSRETCVIRKNTIKIKEEGFFARLMAIITGVKKCSSRAADNELFGGLDKYLSQTFYLSFNDATLSEIYVASNLVQNEQCYFKLKILNLKNSRDIRVTPSDGFRFAVDNLNGIIDADKLSKLRCRVAYVKPDGQEVQITDSMNLIILP